MARWLCVALMLLAGCHSADNPWKHAAKGQKRVVATFPALYSIAQAVAGDDAYVLCLLAAKGPHDYQPAPAEMRKLRDAELILANGLGLDDRLLDRLVAGAGVPKERVVLLGDALPKEQIKAGVEHHGHTHGDHDPHVWLGPPQAILMTRAVAGHLAKLDPDHKEGYAKRAEAFVIDLEALTAHGKKLLAGKSNRNVLAQHESLAYFAAAFDLHVVGSIQTKPGDDANQVKMGQLAQQCKDKDVRVIAVEPQYPRGQAEAIREQLARRGQEVKLVEIDPIETAPLAAGTSNPAPDHYLKTMRKNLDTLAGALP